MASDRAELLPTVPVEEFWGIGGASVAKLAKLGIGRAADCGDCPHPEHWAEGRGLEVRAEYQSLPVNYAWEELRYGKRRDQSGQSLTSDWPTTCLYKRYVDSGNWLASSLPQG